MRFVYEDNLVTLPMVSTVLGYTGFWLRKLDVEADWRKVVHGEQATTVHKPLPTAGTVVGKQRVIGLFDKGKDKARSC